MCKHCSDVFKLRPCLNKESKNSACLRTIVTAALQRQYSQTELIFWISLIVKIILTLWTEVIHKEENVVMGKLTESVFIRTMERINSKPNLAMSPI